MDGREALGYVLRWVTSDGSGIVALVVIYLGFYLYSRFFGELSVEGGTTVKSIDDYLSTADNDVAARAEDESWPLTRQDLVQVWEEVAADFQADLGQYLADKYDHDHSLQTRPY